MPNTLIEADRAQTLIDRALADGGDFAEVFVEHAVATSIQIENGRLKDSSSSLRRGLAIRVIAGEATGLAYCESDDAEEWLRTARLAAAIARNGGSQRPHALQGMALPDRYPVLRPAGESDLTERISLCRRLDAAARNADSAIRFTSAHIVHEDRRFTVAASDGTWAHDHQPMLRTGVRVVAETAGRRESGHRSIGLRQGLELFDRHSPETIAADAVALARFKLDADPCPAGRMPVVLGAGGAGVLVHEAVGHGLEADFNRRGLSAYSGLMGEQVASTGVTIVDEGASPHERGSLNIDDEGSPVDRTVLIENGVLRAYLTDKLTARLMGLPISGNGRRQDYRCRPIPRMRITTMDGGADDPDDLLRGVKRGLYAKRFGGGSVDITKGDYNFEVAEGWLIEDGRLTRPVRGATLVGNGPATMRNVSRIAADATIDANAGTCGKDGQGAPVSFGTPTFLVDELVVGGQG